MRAVAEGRLPNSSTTFERHINRCLGCRACEPVCPAGVEYGQLLEGARSELLTKQGNHGLAHRMLQFGLRHIWLSKARLKFAFAGARLARDLGLVKLLLKSRLPHLLSRQVEFGLALLESSKPWAVIDQPNGSTTVSAPDRKTVMLFKGCVTEGLFSRVNRATARVLEVNGCAIQSPSEQTCCGALHAHAGDLEGARQLAKQNIQAFTDSGEAPIITNAGGCGAMLLSYAHILADDEQWAKRASNFSNRVRDVSQQLHQTGIKPGAEIESSAITYDASCHLINGQHAGELPLQMLQAIPNLNFVPLNGSDRCCGGAGVYNLMEPELSAHILGEKLAQVNATGATVLVTGNPGCHMQIGAGSMLNNSPLRVCHPVELLDESYRRAGIDGESAVPNR